MHNFNMLRSNESYPDEDRILNDGIVSIIGDDYLLSFLNDADPVQKLPIQNNSGYSPYFNELQIPYPNYQESMSLAENYQNGSARLNTAEPWMYQNLAGQSKLHYNFGDSFPFRVENGDEFDGDIKSKKIKTAKDTYLSIKNLPEIPAKHKSHNKNTYANKINHLIAEPAIGNNLDILENQQTLESKKSTSSKKNEKKDANLSENKGEGMKKVRSYDVLKPEQLNKLNVKLARNRESARESRKRKKVYIELLEKKVEQMQQELIITNKQLEQNSASLNNATIQNRILNDIQAGEQKLHEKLNSMIEKKEDETEIGYLIDSLKLRFGANGKERINALNFFFKQIVDFLFPVHMKYLLSIATEEKDIFSKKDPLMMQKLPSSLVNKKSLEEETTEYWREIISQLHFTEAQKKTVQKYKSRFTTEKNKFESLLKELNHIRKDLIKQENSLQNVMDEMSSCFSPAQIAQLLLTLDKEKNRKEFSSERLWFHTQTKREVEDNPSDDVDFLQAP